MEQKYNEALANWKRYKYENQELKSKLDGMQTVTPSVLSVDSSRAESQLDALNQEIQSAVSNIGRIQTMTMMHPRGGEKEQMRMRKVARSMVNREHKDSRAGDEVMARLLLLKKRNAKQQNRQISMKWSGMPNSVKNTAPDWR